MRAYGDGQGFAGAYKAVSTVCQGSSWGLTGPRGLMKNQMEKHMNHEMETGRGEGGGGGVGRYKDIDIEACRDRATEN